VLKDVGCRFWLQTFHSAWVLNGVGCRFWATNLLPRWGAEWCGFSVVGSETRSFG